MQRDRVYRSRSRAASVTADVEAARLAAASKNGQQSNQNGGGGGRGGGGIARGEFFAPRDGPSAALTATAVSQRRSSGAHDADNASPDAGEMSSPPPAGQRGLFGPAGKVKASGNKAAALRVQQGARRVSKQRWLRYGAAGKVSTRKPTRAKVDLQVEIGQKFVRDVDANRPCVFPGNVIEGAVVLNVTSTVMVECQSLRVKFRGKLQTTPDGKHVETSTFYKQVMTIFGPTLEEEDAQANAGRRPGAAARLPIGEHRYPFCFVLPSPTPPSFRSANKKRFACCSHSIRVTLDILDDLAAEKTVELQVLKPERPRTRDLFSTIPKSVTQAPLWNGCCTQGEVRSTLTLTTPVVQLGRDKVVVTCSIDNSTGGRKIRGVTLRFVQRTTCQFRPMSLTKDLDAVIDENTERFILAPGTEKRHRVTMTFDTPEGLVPTTYLEHGSVVYLVEGELLYGVVSDVAIDLVELPFRILGPPVALSLWGKNDANAKAIAEIRRQQQLMRDRDGAGGEGAPITTTTWSAGLLSMSGGAGSNASGNSRQGIAANSASAGAASGDVRTGVDGNPIVEGGSLRAAVFGGAGNPTGGAFSSTAFANAVSAATGLGAAKTNDLELSIMSLSMSPTKARMNKSVLQTQVRVIGGRKKNIQGAQSVRTNTSSSFALSASPMKRAEGARRPLGGRSEQRYKTGEGFEPDKLFEITDDDEDEDDDPRTFSLMGVDSSFNFSAQSMRGRLPDRKGQAAEAIQALGRSGSPANPNLHSSVAGAGGRRFISNLGSPSRQAASPAAAASGTGALDNETNAPASSTSRQAVSSANPSSSNAPQHAADGARGEVQEENVISTLPVPPAIRSVSTGVVADDGAPPPATLPGQTTTDTAGHDGEDGDAPAEQGAAAPTITPLDINHFDTGPADGGGDSRARGGNGARHARGGGGQRPRRQHSVTLLGEEDPRSDPAADLHTADSESHDGDGGGGPHGADDGGGGALRTAAGLTVAASVHDQPNGDGEGQHRHGQNQNGGPGEGMSRSGNEDEDGGNANEGMDEFVEDEMPEPIGRTAKYKGEVFVRDGEYTAHVVADEERFRADQMAAGASYLSPEKERARRHAAPAGAAVEVGGEDGEEGEVLWLSVAAQSDVEPVVPSRAMRRTWAKVNFVAWPEALPE